MFFMILINLNISRNLAEMELQYCKLNQNVLLFLIKRCLNAENVKLNAKMKKYGDATQTTQIESRYDSRN